MSKKLIRGEIISPAGNIEKLKFAVKYGAGSVYFGGEELNLRAKAGNFSREKIEESILFCKQNNVKTLFLLNSFLQENDIDKAKKYINNLKGLDFDALMVSDPGMLMLIREAGIDCEVHLSTQMSTLNHLSLKFWKDAGFDRIVLGREVSLDEIKKIKDQTDIEIEVFIHGALCIAYSGRCLISRFLTGRDANQGDCAQPCRWNFSLREKRRPGLDLDFIEHTNGTELLSSLDLNMIGKIDEYVKAGVDAFKIEGRMKSLYHAANTTRIYKHAVELAGTDEFQKNMPFWKKELDLINHRPYTDDIFNEFDNLGFHDVPYVTGAQFLGYKISDGSAKKEVLIKTFSSIYKGESIDIIYPIKGKIIDDSYVIDDIIDNNGKSVETATQSNVFKIIFNKPVSDDGILRRVKKA